MQLVKLNYIPRMVQITEIILWADLVVTTMNEFTCPNNPSS